MNDKEFRYIAFVVYTDETYRYGFNQDTADHFGGPEAAARALCPRDEDPVEVIIV